MKRLIGFLLIAGAFLTASCNCELSDGTGVVETYVNVSFSAGGTKASAAYSGEYVINDVNLFVARIAPDGTEESVERYYTETGSVSVKVKFPSEGYKYSFRAYGNFGSITAEPRVVEFSKAMSNGMKMHGEAVISESTAKTGSISMLMQRYVGKVVVNSVKLDWGSDYSGYFTLDEMYVANAGKSNDFIAESMYNPEGVHKVTDMDQYLYEDIGGIAMQNGDIHAYQHFFYAFNGYTSDNQTSLIIAVTYEGEKMYYSIPLLLDENCCYVYDFVILGAGLDAPYGDKVTMEKSAIDVIVRSFSAEDWSEYSETIYSEDTGYADTDVEVQPDYS